MNHSLSGRIIFWIIERMQHERVDRPDKNQIANERRTK